MQAQWLQEDVPSRLILLKATIKIIIYIDNDSASIGVLTLIDEFMTLSFFAESKSFICDEFIGWETIMKFNDPNSSGTDLGLSEYFLSGSLTHLISSQIDEWSLLKGFVGIGGQRDS